ncbi:MAG: histidine kinase N-terminal domain-containing protein [Actinomycetaceae bacterium]|nr:histidine kinase N-terminal domain-containing protein [Arcanobacterium sp.]MDD7505625.1 histidine kinase N-terminal domain-containing protein [Actinomycetaceae bacterium]MDY6143403.1 histidine kinase N-terminal domain-containing protein [Arcanobacterium sp.]
MPTLSQLIQRSDHPRQAVHEWLHQLAGDWQVIADVSFADLILYLHTDEGYIAAAQTRPSTAATLVENDIVGEPIERDEIETLDDVLTLEEKIVKSDDVVLDQFTPVRCEGEIVAIMRVMGAVFADRVPAQAHESYEEISDCLIDMVAAGDFPFEGTPAGYRHGMPRVSDGVIHLDAEGIVKYASPNAVSYFRRLGIDEPLAGNMLAEMVTEHLDPYSPPDESLPVVLMGKAAWVAETEAQGVTVMMRAVPLLRDGQRIGALLLCRDTGEIRRRERELMTKDATIKEINHRVKNNLQTVSALLRLQARRASSEESRVALEQAQRRVSMIALVHEGLSQNIDEIVTFDEVFGSILRTVRDIGVTEAPVDIRMEGTFGEVRAEQATALALVLNEVISNAIEHGLKDGGSITVRAVRDEQLLSVDVIDDGDGLGGKEPSSGLGSQIVRTLVYTELNGSIQWQDAHPHGTVVHLELHLRK